MFTQLEKSIYRLAGACGETVGYKVKKIKFAETKLCKIFDCETLSGIIKIVFVSDKDPDRDIVISLQHPCIIHGLSKLVVENWCSVGWLCANTKTKKKICCRREYFQLSADLEVPVDNMIDQVMFWCPGCSTNKIVFAAETEVQEAQIDAFVEKDCPGGHLDQVNVVMEVNEKVMDILFDTNASFPILVQKLYIAYRYFGIANLYDGIILILCSQKYNNSESSIQILPIEIITIICQIAWKSRWSNFNRAVNSQYEKYM